MGGTAVWKSGHLSVVPKIGGNEVISHRELNGEGEGEYGIGDRQPIAVSGNELEKKHWKSSPGAGKKLMLAEQLSSRSESSQEQGDFGESEKWDRGSSW